MLTSKSGKNKLKMKTIDLENWKRKGHFDFFRRMDYPQFNLCMDIDVTNLVAFTKRNELSFYYSMIFAATAAINQVEDFKYRIRGEQVVVHDRIHPSFTDMDKNGADDLFKFVTVDLSDDIFEFVSVARQTSENQQDYFGPAEVARRDDLIYITCIPWVSFTQLTHTISLNKNDSVPRISWGKFYKQGDKTLLPFSVQAHHALVDGFHVGKYVEALQALIDAQK